MPKGLSEKSKMVSTSQQLLYGEKKKKRKKRKDISLVADRDTKSRSDHFAPTKTWTDGRESPSSGGCL